MEDSKLIQIAQGVFQEEIQELNAIANRLNNSFIDAVNAIYQTKGKVVIVGVGKSSIDMPFMFGIGNLFGTWINKSIFAIIVEIFEKLVMTMA